MKQNCGSVTEKWIQPCGKYLGIPVDNGMNKGEVQVAARHDLKSASPPRVHLPGGQRQREPKAEHGDYLMKSLASNSILVNVILPSTAHHLQVL